jgi:hypothetical protein
MMLRKRSAISLCILIAAAALAVAPSTLAALDEEERAAQKEQALQQIVGQLEEKSVRPVEKSTVEKEAQRILSRLTAEQVEALAESDAPVQNVTANAVGDAESDLLFVPLAPCRIIDTRLGGGIITAGSTRAFRAAGTSGFEAQGGKSGGCGVPIGASSPVAAAVMINLVAIDVAGKGNLAAWEFGQPEPLASSINFQKIDMNIANGLIVPIAGVSSQTADLNVKANFNNAHLVADVTGYFTRFPVENFQGGLKSSLQTHDFTTLILLGDGACHELNSCTVTADVPGTVVVEAWGQFVMEHAGGTLDRVAIGVETAATVACLAPDSVNASDYEVPASLGSNPDVDFTISHGVAFTQPGGTTRTYRLSGQVVSGGSANDKIENSRLICTFIPD